MHIMPPPLALLLLGAKQYTVCQTKVLLPLAWSSAESNAKPLSTLSSSTSTACMACSLCKQKPAKLADNIDFNLETHNAKKLGTDNNPQDKKQASMCKGFDDSLRAVQPTTPNLPDTATADILQKGMPHLGSRPITVVANERDSPHPLQPCPLNCGCAEREFDWKSEHQSKPPPLTEIFHDLSTATSDKALDTSPRNCLTSDDWDITYDTIQDLYRMGAMNQFAILTQLESQDKLNESIMQTRQSTPIVTPHKSRREPLLIHTPPSGSNNL
jgi:hypothetical protein